MQTPAAENWPMWIPPARPVWQRDTAYIGLDDQRRSGLAFQLCRPMWISSTRLAEQHTTAYTGLDDVQHMGFAEQRDGGDDASTRRHTKAERTRRHTKAERQAFGALVTTSTPVHPVSAALTLAGNPHAVASAQTDCAYRYAAGRTQAWTSSTMLGRTMAAPAAAQVINTAADTGRLTAAGRPAAAPARHVVVAASHVDTSTHYQTADGRVHLLPPGCGPVQPIARPRRPSKLRRQDRAAHATPAPPLPRR